MEKELEPLRIPFLTNMEAGQLMKRHQGDLATIDPALLTDAPFSNYVQTITNQSVRYEHALAQIQKNEETEKISHADADRDKADYAFATGLKLYSLSDDPAEVEASKSLGILFGSFKDLPNLNYEAQTIATDKLVSELTGPNYSPKVSLLQMDRYVTRLSTTNEAFKALFSGRMVTTAMTEVYDMKTVRKETMKTYSDFTAYVLSMAKALNTPLFNTALNLLNTARKYYADQLARSATPKEKKEKPVA
jgi:hypothetical protein